MPAPRDTVTIEPEPSAEEREAILAALARPVGDEDDGEVEGWAATALLEGVDADELDP